MSTYEPPMEEPGHAFHQEMIDAVVNAHIGDGAHLSERIARGLLVRLGMDAGEADELLTDARLCAQQE
jgi:hypothetical protein